MLVGENPGSLDCVKDRRELQVVECVLSESAIVHGRFLVAVSHADALRDICEYETSERNQEENGHASTEPECDEYDVDDEGQTIVHKEERAGVNSFERRHRLCVRLVLVTRANRFLISHAPNDTDEHKEEELGNG